MTMHLCHASLTTTGKKRGRAKFRNAEAAQKARTAEAEWQALKERWGVGEPERKRNQAIKAPALKASYLSYPPGREPKQHIPSRDTGVTGAVASKPSQQYTGTKMLGIGTMHKSNSVPIFSEEDAVAIATMRRN